MKPNSIDLCQRVLGAADRGISRRQIVEMFEVSLSTVKRYLKLRSQTGQLAPKPIPGRTPTRGVVLTTDLPAQLAAYHDFALELHCKLWASSHGVSAAGPSGPPDALRQSLLQWLVRLCSPSLL
jgi:hypothetical protein